MSSQNLPVIHLTDRKSSVLPQFIAVVKGKSIRLYGQTKKYLPGGPATGTLVEYDKTYKIGDIVEYDSYNISYTGRILAIGPKTVTVSKGTWETSRTARMSLEDFNNRNFDFDLEATQKRNAAWMD